MDILIIKTGALGDVLRSSFIAQALKDKYKQDNPNIYWLTDEKANPLLANNPYINEIVNYGQKDSLKRINFDIVINLEEDNEICSFALSLNYKRIIGFIYKSGKILPTQTAKEWFNMSALGEKPKNDILKKKNKKTYRQILSEVVGIADYEKYEPFLRLTNNQINFSQDFLRRHNLSRTDMIIGINTGSADRWPKQLSINKTAKLIDKLYRGFSKPHILLFGGPGEIERNREILKLAKSPIITTGCGNDLFEFPSLISICSLFITADTLGLHAALALKRKTVVLIGPTSPDEIDMYGIGEKVIAKSKCICCYKQDCKSMGKIDLDEIMILVKKLLYQKITLLITAFKEPNISKAIESALNQKTRYNYDLIVSAPDKDTLDIVKKYAKTSKIKIFKDPGKGKSYALNLIFDSIKTDILMLTDGDVYISDNAIEEISNLFLNPQIGCASGRPVPIENKKTKYGYWANFLFDSAHRLRKTAFESNSFLECSAYLFAFRKDKIKKIPLDVAEDTIIPYYLWEKGYTVGYAENALVYVKNPANWKDWIKQKTRTGKSHETLEKYVDVKTTPRVKSFKTEAKGIFWLLKYPRSIKEGYWTKLLILARLYMWLKVFYDTKLKGRHYGDAWERVESTK